MLNENQVLLTGQIGGLLMTLNQTSPGSILDLEVEVDAEGNYTNRIFVTQPSGVYAVTVDGPAKKLPPRDQTDAAIAARERTRRRLEGH